MSAKISIVPDRYTREGPDFTLWTVAADIDKVGGFDGSGSTVEMAFANLAQTLAEEVETQSQIADEYINANDYLQTEVKRLREGIERLASAEGFDHIGTIPDSSLGSELRARMNFASNLLGEE